MTDKPLRRGRRDNGLEASEYAVAADLDPRIGEHLLDVLALAKIAAYLQPTSDLDPVTRSSMLPARPTDRLYVDRAHLEEAREYARRLETGNDPLDSDAAEGGKLDDFESRWQELVAQLESDAADRTADPDRGMDTERGADQTAESDSDTSWKAKDFQLPRIRTALPLGEEPTLLDALDADYDDGDESFVPPEPPPVPKISQAAAISLGLIGLGVLVLVWPQLLVYLNIRDPEVALVVAAVFLVAGSVGLVLRLRAAPDEEDPDDGARV